MSRTSNTVLLVNAACASPGRNFPSATIGAEYIVANGFADCLVFVFLENMHSKWIADQLLG